MQLVWPYFDSTLAIAGKGLQLVWPDELHGYPRTPMDAITASSASL